ncbi:hypothetical protein OV203_08535 [Nannocystis sp. ILAH1]|uniref:hypothetical protein n=1 Tax=Nannocystis sp. ILAH1 TaxID=2996789 RepID=UPI00226EFA23|nr:hypothetical protein [Nannocystis sp. ILAH1]MCY0987168.1 hypothetical protein [Nannocystis sp. ILAH1]
MSRDAILTSLLISLTAAPMVAANLSGGDGRGPYGADHDVLGSAADRSAGDLAAHAFGGGQHLRLTRPSPRPWIDADSKDAMQRCSTAFVLSFGALWYPAAAIAGAGYLTQCALELACLFTDCAGDGV